MEGARRKWLKEVHKSSNKNKKGMQPTFIFILWANYWIFRVDEENVWFSCRHSIFSSTENHNTLHRSAIVSFIIQSANITYRVLHKLSICGSSFRITWATNSVVIPCEWSIEQPLEWGSYISNSALGTTHELCIEGTGSFVIRKRDLIAQWWTNNGDSCHWQLLG